jgi:hypothetical protein
MRPTTLLLTVALAASAFGAPAIADGSVSTTTSQNLDNRTLCFNIFGFQFGSCYGSWGKGRYNQYRSQCEQRGWKYGQRTGAHGELSFQWGVNWIVESNWSSCGKYWMPKDTTKWGCEGPAPWTPRGPSTPDCFKKYKDACRHKGYEPHYYWDEYKGGYYYWFQGSFYFEADFVFTTDGQFWVPKSCAW